MAKQRQQTQPNATVQGGGRKRLSPTTFIGLVIIFVLLVLVALPTVMLLFFGMLPTIVAYFIDRTQQKYAAFSVGGLNFCGVFPHVLELWDGYHSIGSALGILTDVFSLVVMYGVAVLGWALFSVIPPVVVSVLTVMAQRRVANLRTSQRHIIEEWGEDVAKSTSGD